MADKSKREPRLWLLRRGGVRVEGEDGTTVSVELSPREMRRLAQKLRMLAGDIAGPASRIGAEAIEDDGAF